jgi:prolyl oligopeptidase
MNAPSPASAAASAAASTLPTSARAAGPTGADDPFLWLEDVQGDRALAWVRERNAQSEAAIESLPGHAERVARIRAILDSREQIPYVGHRGGLLYNFWRDQDHPRGLWRRTTLAEFRKPEPAWEVLLDVDALGRQEGVNWVWAGATVLGPENARAMVSLSKGGADAVVIREFDLGRRAFVPDGFVLPEAKGSVQWIDRDTLFVATDFGPGSTTDSGYPRTVRRWRRGQPLAEAVTVFEGDKADVAVGVSVDRTPGFERVSFERALDFYRTRVELQKGPKSVPIDKPDDASATFWREWIVLELRSDWPVGATTWRRGSLLAQRLEDHLAGRHAFQVLFEPTQTRFLSGWTATRSALVLHVLDNVASRLEERRFDGQRWIGREVKAPHPGRLDVTALHDPLMKDDPLGEAVMVNYADFLTPDSLLLGRAGQDGLEALKRRPRFFDSASFVAEQHFARSADGTRVPYFVVRPRQMRSDGRNPTLLYGYGGFEVSMTPFYSGIVGSQWLERGGIYVVANIRGGGEFGPGWHQAALRQQRQRSFDDFIAVAEDLVRRGLTTREHLGISGGSNGGLLVGAVMVQRPELFRAVLCSVPLLDMKRYHLLLAGASWMAEYGNPDDPNDWAVLSRYSPYQNVKAGVKMPSVLFTTSTRDDRVHPGHARKMAARMLEQGHPVLYWENIEGGHGGAADNGQRARLTALEFGFLWRELAPR